VHHLAKLDLWKRSWVRRREGAAAGSSYRQKTHVSNEVSSGHVRRPTGSTDPISRRTGQWLQLRLLDMRSEETDMDDCEYY